MPCPDNVTPSAWPSVLVSLVTCIFGLGLGVVFAADPPAPASVGAGTLDPAAVKPGVWYKRTPLAGAPRNPRMGYEAAWAYDPFEKVILRWGGHNQGGGGEQNSEVWVYDPLANTFKLMEPNYSPPGSCCNRDQVFDIANRRYVRFPSFSASHGWQWRREVYQMQSSAWTYDYPTNTWRNMRPWPQANPGPLRGAAYDTDNQVTVVAQGEGVRWGTAVYDLYTNTWTMMNAKNEPPERNTFGFAYDPVGRKFVSFGSQSGSDPRTWIYDPRKNEWTAHDLNPHPPEVKNGAVMAYDPFNKVMLCVALTWKDGIDPEDKTPAKVPDALETWAFDPAKMTWTKLNPPAQPDPSGSRNRLLLFVPDLNVFVLEDRTNKEQQMWIYRYADYTPPKQPSLLMGGVHISTAKDRVTLTWHGMESTDFDVYRAAGEKPWLADYARIGTGRTGVANYSSGAVFVDDKVKPATVYSYYIVPRGRDGAERPPSPKVRAQPPVVDNLVASVDDVKKVELAWDKGPADVSGYFVYRAPVVVSSTDQYTPIRDKHKVKNPLAEPQVGIWRIAGDFVKLNDLAVQANSFTDTTADLGKPLVPAQPEKFSDAKGKPYKFAVYAYRVTAVNNLGVESGPSPYVLTIPGPVANLKSRERPGETDLRWSPNPEKGIAGYRIYRLEGRFEDQAVTLLTPEPLKGTTYTDKIANGPDDDAKRYYVVAVDALGQEGVAGASTWGSREYAKYYKGFLEEWHQ